MMPRRLDILLPLVCAALCLSGCRSELKPEEPARLLPEDAAVLLLSAGSGGLEMSAETRALSGNWIQQMIGMTNVAIAIFDHGSGKKVYAGAKYPFKVISPAEPYQMAWLLGNFTPEEGHTYDLAFACNFPKAAELTAFLNTSSWSELTDHEPVNPTFQMSRKDMSNPTTVANAAGDDENYPVVKGYGSYGGPNSGDEKDKMYVNQWRSPILSGFIRGITIEKGGINLVGFRKNDTGYEPAVTPAALNADLGTAFTDSTLPPLKDATSGLEDAARKFRISPCYALLVVDNLIKAGEALDKLEITDIFMMNVPMYHHLFADETYHFGASPENFKNSIGRVAYSTGKDLVSGFKPSWIDASFMSRTAGDDFARILHYPADGKVSQTDFINQYRSGEGNTADKQGDNNDNSRYFFKLAATGQLLDRLCVSIRPEGGKTADYPDDFSKNMTGNWAWLQSHFPLAYKTNDTRKAPFFLLSDNRGDYPNELTTDENGSRQYLFATRLVIRGKWKETPESEEEIVYYPIMVNGPAQGFTIDNESSIPEEERSNFVHRGRRYIYSITIQSKGVRNPWTATRVPVTLGNLELKVDNWDYYDVELPKYIY